MKRAVFFERDSLLVLNTPGLAQRSPLALDQLALQQGALPGLQRLKAAGFVLIATSYLIESPWLGRGRHNFVARDIEAALEKLTERERLNHRVA